MECKNNICGYVYYPSVLQDNLVFSYVPCKYKKKLDNDTKYQDNIISFDMPKEIICLLYTSLLLQMVLLFLYIFHKKN